MKQEILVPCGRLELENSHGTLFVNAGTGQVISWHPTCECDGAKGCITDITSVVLTIINTGQGAPDK